MLARASDPAQLDVLAAEVHDSQRGTSEGFYVSRSSHQSVPLQHPNKPAVLSGFFSPGMYSVIFSSPGREKVCKFLPVVAKHPLLDGLWGVGRRGD